MTTVPICCPVLGQCLNVRNLFFVLKWHFPLCGCFPLKTSLLSGNNSCHCSQEARDFVFPLSKVNLNGPSRNRVAGNLEATVVVLEPLLIPFLSQSQMEAQIRLVGLLEES